MTSGVYAFRFARIDARGSATLNSRYNGNGAEGRPTTSAPKSFFGPPLGAKRSTSSPFFLKHSIVLVSMVTMPSILGRNGSVIRATLILAVPLSKRCLAAPASCATHAAHSMPYGGRLTMVLHRAVAPRQARTARTVARVLLAATAATPGGSPPPR